VYGLCVCACVQLRVCVCVRKARPVACVCSCHSFVRVCSLDSVSWSVGCGERVGRLLRLID
jgi:hypothetical protein